VVDEEQEVEIVPSMPSLPLATLLYAPSNTLTGDIAEVSPVSAAIARHMGINLTPDGIAARNRRGIAIIVHGAPLSGMHSLYTFLFSGYSRTQCSGDVHCTALLTYLHTPHWSLPLLTHCRLVTLHCTSNSLTFP